jgi:putative endopeptidase
MKRFKHSVLLLLTILLALSLFISCAAPKTPLSPSEPPYETPSPTPSTEPLATPGVWMNSNLIGTVTAETPVNLKDDFYLAQNFDWLSTAQIPEGYAVTGAFRELRFFVRDNIEAILADTSLDSHEAKLAQTLYNAYLDMDRRNALGVEPLMPLVEEVQAISNLNEMTEYLKKNGNFYTESVDPDYMDSNRYGLSISQPVFSLRDADEYRSITEQGQKIKDANDVYSLAALQKIGYTAFDAQKIIDAAFDFETRIAEASFGLSIGADPDRLSKTYNPMTREELAAKSPVFPLVQSLDARGYTSVDLYIVADLGCLERMNELYTQANVEAMKALILVNILDEHGENLDEDFLKLTIEKKESIDGVENLTVEQLAYENVESQLDYALSKLYEERYFSEETRTDVENIAKELIGTYRKRLEANTWLSDETRAKAIEKLDSMYIVVGHPGQWIDYSSLTFGEGETLVDYYQAVKEFVGAWMIAKLKCPVVKPNWEDIGVTSQTVNAFYNPLTNSINITPGILNGHYYNAEDSWETKLGSIGMVIGHEITHAFDFTGGQFDKDGNMVNWWTAEDTATFKERMAKVSAYFSTMQLQPGVYLNGDLLVNEAVADMGGFACLLEIAKNSDLVVNEAVADYEDFDYEEFFSSFALIWRRVENMEYLLDGLTDTHPPAFLRVNVVVQQFEKFYEIYGVEPGDGMYLSPDLRIAVW